MTELDEDLQAYRPGAVKIDIDRGRRRREAIRSLADRAYSEEQQLLSIREQELSATTTGFWWSLAFGYGIIVLTGASLYRNVRQYSQQTAEAEHQLSKLNEGLEQRVRERTASLQAREILLNTFVQRVPAAVVMLDRDMRYLQVSDHWCAAHSLNSPDILGHSHYEIFPDVPERWKEIHRRCLGGETFRAQEDRWARADGSVRWIRWEIRPWGDKNGLPEGILMFSEDVTERKRTEALLQESEATTRALLDTAGQAILAVNSAGVIVLTNRMTAKMFGYDSEELIGQPHDILVPQRLREIHKMHRAEFSIQPITRPMGTGPVLAGLRKDGSEFPIEVSLSSVETGHGPLAVSFVSDITARKQAESALRESEQQLRALAGSLLTAQEDKRRRIARELHDDITQRLAFLSIELGKLAAEAPDGLESFRAHLRGLQNQTLNASTEVRRISHGLHPSVISDFGLSIALEDFCQEFENTQRIRVEFGGPVDDSQLDHAAATCLYRIAQEAMRNAVTHGQATKVRVVLSVPKGLMQLQVIDNGQGFAPGSVPAKPGLGIVSMRERIRMVNGSVTISSEPQTGTTITASVPLTAKP